MLKKQASTRLFRAASRSKLKTAHAIQAKPKRKAKVKRDETRPSDIGIWDIDVHAGYLYRVLDAINKTQDLFKFSRIEATVPTGLTLSGERTRAIVQHHGGEYLDPSISQNTWAEDIYRVARPIHQSLGSKLLVCMIAPMIMDYEDDDENSIGWNYFSVSKKPIVLVSAYQLREYADAAKRPFEACLAATIVTQVFVESFAKVEFHDETRGCILDACEKRDDIVEMFQGIGLCEESLALFPGRTRPDVLKIIDAIREYHR